MGHVIDCTDLGFLCNWRGRGSSRNDVTAALKDHLGEAHAITSTSATLTAYVEKALRQADEGHNEEPRGVRRSLAKMLPYAKGRLVGITMKGAKQ